MKRVQSSQKTIESNLISIKKQYNATSVVLYIKDDRWKGELKLAASVGLTYPEAIKGFLSYAHVKSISGDGHVKRLYHQAFTSNHAAERDPQHFHPSGDFHKRESIRFALQIILRATESIESSLAEPETRRSPEAVLYINFQTEPSNLPSNDAIHSHIGQSFNKMRTPLRRIQNEETSTDILLSQTCHSLDYLALSTLRDTPGADTVLFTQQLKSMFAALGLDASRDMAAVYALSNVVPNSTDSARHMYKVASVGRSGVPESIPCTKSICGFVAITTNTVISNAFQTCQIRYSYHEFAGRKPKHVLAVPLLLNDTPWGAMIFESFGPRQFTLTELRVLQFLSQMISTARSAAFRLRSLNDSTSARKYLNDFLSSDTPPHATSSPSAVLSSALELSRKVARSKSIDVWLRVNPTESQPNQFWDYLGGSPRTDPYPRTPRADGWSQYCIDHDLAICVTNNATLKKCNVVALDCSKSPACQKLEGSLPPIDVRSDTFERSSFRVAVPCVVDRGTKVILWLSFESESQIDPNHIAERIDNFRQAVQLLFALYFSQKMATDLRSVQSALTSCFSRHYRDLVSIKSHICDIAVETRCVEPPVGGDFVVARSTASRTGLSAIVGDVEGHGIAAAPFACQLMEIASWALRGTTSTREMLRRIAEAYSNDSERQSKPFTSMLLFTESVDSFTSHSPSEVQLNSAPRKYVIWGSTSGHPVCWIYRRVGGVSSFPDRPAEIADGTSTARTAPIGYVQGIPLVNECFQGVSSGDVLIVVTDGVSDAFDPKSRQRGPEDFDRSALSGYLCEAVTGDRDARSIAKKVLNEAMARSSLALRDDMTVFALVWK